MKQRIRGGILNRAAIVYDVIFLLKDKLWIDEKLKSPKITSFEKQHQRKRLLVTLILCPRSFDLHPVIFIYKLFNLQDYYILLYIVFLVLNDVPLFDYHIWEKQDSCMALIDISGIDVFGHKYLRAVLVHG